MQILDIICVEVFPLLTNQLLVPDVQGHVSESGGHGTHHLVVVYPQQLHQDGEAFVLAHSSPDVHRPLRGEISGKMVKCMKR